MTASIGADVMLGKILLAVGVLGILSLVICYPAMIISSRISRKEEEHEQTNRAGGRR